MSQAVYIYFFLLIWIKNYMKKASCNLAITGRQPILFIPQLFNGSRRIREPRTFSWKKKKKRKKGEYCEDKNWSLMTLYLFVTFSRENSGRRRLISQQETLNILSSKTIAGPESIRIPFEAFFSFVKLSVRIY